ncbi:hypothetical protein ACS0TY_022480 [Phlomoides rotata]
MEEIHSQQKPITMARLCRKKAEIVLVVEEIVFEIIFMLTMLLNRRRDRSRFRVSDVQRLVRYRMVDRIPQQLEHLNELTQLSDVDCFNNLRMKRNTFNHFCYLLRHSGGLVDGRYVSVGEQVAIFLSVFSHHSKVRVVKFCFKRSSHTVHQHFHNVLRAVLNLHGSLLASPTPVDDECTHSRWKHFKVGKVSFNECFVGSFYFEMVDKDCLGGIDRIRNTIHPFRLFGIIDSFSIEPDPIFASSLTSSRSFVCEPQ